jgi:AraC-like DNA-binding protein
VPPLPIATYPAGACFPAEARCRLLPHEPLIPESAYEAYFGAPVSFLSTRNALSVSSDTLNICLLHHSEQLHRIATDYLNVQFPFFSADVLLAGRVERAVRKTLGTNSCNRESVARAMAIHPRTLQRRLQLEGTSFDEIRDRIRREKVKHYLYDTAMPLSQVADMVGYSKQAILSRSCRRWFGQSPQRLRMSRSS